MQLHALLSPIAVKESVTSNVKDGWYLPSQLRPRAPSELEL